MFIILQVFSWRSADDIENVVLPFLNDILEVEQGIIKTSLNMTAKNESLDKVAQLTSSIKGWQSVLDRNSQLLINASSG